MTVPLTRDLLRATWDMLNEVPPFNKWNHPSGEDIVFHVGRSKDYYGRYWHDRRHHHIEISSGLVGSVPKLIETMAHEKIHFHEKLTGMCKSGVEHSAAFKKLAAKVCKALAFDPKAF